MLNESNILDFKKKIRRGLLLLLLIIIGYIVTYTLDVLDYTKLNYLQENIDKYDIVASTYDYPGKELRLLDMELTKVKHFIQEAHQGGSKEKKTYDYSLIFTFYEGQNVVAEIMVYKDNLNSIVISRGHVGKVPVSLYSYDKDSLITYIYYQIVKK